MKSRLIPWLAAQQQLSGWLYWYTNWGFRHSASSTDLSTGLDVPLGPLNDTIGTSYNAFAPLSFSLSRARVRGLRLCVSLSLSLSLSVCVCVCLTDIICGAGSVLYNPRADFRTNGDGNLLYAGEAGHPLSSQRLELLRMGFEDRCV